MRDILAEIVEHKRQEVVEAKRRTPQADLEKRVGDMPAPRNFFAAVTQPKDTLRVIAEVKRASPSAGLIRKDFDPVSIAKAYHENGAAAISCLTDGKYFHGSIDDLQAVRGAVPLPVLRKDFIIDPYQVYETRASGADAILLISECLDEARLLDLLILATKLKLTTLVEVHDIENLLKIRPHVGFPHPAYTLVGINNRDLKSMTTDLSHTLRLLDMVEDPSILVSESGITSPQDVARLRGAGIHRILVGEHLLRQADVGKALRELMAG